MHTYFKYISEKNFNDFGTKKKYFRYEKTDASLWWQELAVAKEQSRFYTCLPKTQSTNPFHPAQYPFYFKVNNENKIIKPVSEIKHFGTQSDLIHIKP